VNWIAVGVAAVVIIALVIGIAATVGAVVLARRTTRPFPDGVVTTGVVIDHELHAGPDGHRTLIPVFRFIDETGVERVARDQVGGNGSIPLGSTFDISYRPSDPTRVRRIAPR
jgi:hypothetical protein